MYDIYQNNIMYIVAVALNKNQLQKALRGDSFQLTAEQLQMKPNVYIQLSSKAKLSLVLRNRKNNKGARFTNDSFKLLSDGNGIFDDIGNVAKKLGNQGVNYLKKEGQKAGKELLNVAKNRAIDISNDTLRDLTGQDINVRDIAKLRLKDLERVGKKAGNQLLNVAKNQALDVGNDALQDLIGQKVDLRKLANFNPKDLERLGKQVGNQVLNRALREGKEIGKDALKGFANNALDSMVDALAPPGLATAIDPALDLAKKAMNKKINGLGVRKPKGASSVAMYPKIPKNGGGFKPAGTGFKPAGSGIKRGVKRGRGFMPV